jgi:hypothetical protein
MTSGPKKSYVDTPEEQLLDIVQKISDYTQELSNSANGSVKFIRDIEFIMKDKTTEYELNEKARMLFKMNTKLTYPMVIKRIHTYLKEHNLMEANRICRVDQPLAEALDLTQDQIQRINSATNVREYDCMSAFNLSRYGIKCIRL